MLHFFAQFKRLALEPRKRSWRVLPKRRYTTGNPQDVASQKKTILSISNKNYLNEICIFSNKIALVTFLHPKLERNPLHSSTA